MTLWKAFSWQLKLKTNWKLFKIRYNFPALKAKFNVHNKLCLDGNCKLNKDFRL